ncbi:MAG: L,D-transpeptidase family protein, partial [Rhodothermales bacterium]|nr:L,D-transpeptidase family protein [Rhodothermales bacterium]
MEQRLADMSKTRKTLFHSLIGISILLTGIAHADAVQNQIAEQAAAIERGQITNIEGIRLTAPDFLTELYALREYQPLWRAREQSEELIRELFDARRHGFRPEDFSLNALLASRNAADTGNPAAQAKFDIAATEAAARLLHHVYFGKVDPVSLDPNWSLEGVFMPAIPAAMVNQYLELATLGALVDNVEITHPGYRRLQNALDRYMTIDSNGGWPEVPEGTSLRVGQEDERIPALKRRLAITGDYAGDDYDTSNFEGALLAAVQNFQTRHGLEADGLIGPKTFRALNRTVPERIDQLRASLERARWLFRDLGEYYVFVNIGGPETYLVQNGEMVWRARSIVGQAYRQTPIFRDTIQYMEFNPTWTVPVSIFLKDKLPLIRRDPNYLKRGGYTVLDSEGRLINPSLVNWAGSPRVTLRQEPGSKNALGQVKFMFPNIHSVYLHDTDDRSLFNRNERNLSSGCVRIENPFELADLLMKDDPNWSA